MKCTARPDGRGGQACQQVATLAVVWTDLVTAGWSITNDRAYCRPHGEDAIAKLNERGVTVSLTPLAKPLTVLGGVT